MLTWQIGVDLLVITILTMAACGSGVENVADGVCKTGGCGPVSAVRSDQARYDNYRIYNVQFDNEEQIKLFQKLEDQSDSLTFIGHAREIGQKLSILVAAHRVADFADILKTYKMQHRVLTYNFQEKIDRNLREVIPEGIDPSKYDWHHYFHLKTIYEWIDQMAVKYPERLTVLDMGTSTQGNQIKGVKVGHNPSNKAIFIESGIHAREWIAPATATYIINELLTSTADYVQKLASNYNWIIFPCVNPDGYKYTFEHDRMWRKNRQLFGTCRGVDLNRNYPDHWNTTGSSSDPTRYDFAGPTSASELETQRLIEFIRNNVEKEHIKTYIALHSYSQMLMFPSGYTKERVPNYDDLQEFGKKAAAAIKAESGRDYVSGSLYETIYPSSGGSMDWAYSEAKIPIAYTFELRGPPDSEDLFILPAAEIQPTASEAFAAIRAIVEAAAEKDYYK
ncbi:zinc carboxypeptidase [Scaptodrosophila lebanonensis]|uniref:Zinc carboxypeptidase A 1 n=1 Tax=Drosophila lebanonensis TaxID=7225 RepID=A0A6J2TEB8_DROLE|nr:zinc carboxypeptidase [Scaptodrosophila lebanonensis]